MDLLFFETVVESGFLNLVLGLLMLIGANILLGSINAIFNGEFDTQVLLSGCAKGGLVAVCAVALFFAGLLNPDIVAIEVGGEQLTILTAIDAVVLAGYYLYAKQVFLKLATMLKNGNLEVVEDSEVTTTVVTEIQELAAAVGTDVEIDEDIAEVTGD